MAKMRVDQLKYDIKHIQVGGPTIYVPIDLTLLSQVWLSCDDASWKHICDIKIYTLKSDNVCLISSTWTNVSYCRYFINVTKYLSWAVTKAWCGGTSGTYQPQREYIVVHLSYK